MYIVISLRRKVKKLVQENQKKSAEIETLRHNLKITRFAEIDAEINAYREECSRLRDSLSEVMSSRENSRLA